MKILTVENIHASYGKKEVLKGISLYINSDEIVSIVGPNGSGKSTLLKTIIGLLYPSQGKVIFNNIDITYLPAFERSNLGIGYLFQGGSVFTNLTVKDNLLLALKNISDTASYSINVYSIFPELEKYISTRAGLLSGGLRQMLSLAMILIRKPSILLLDEPSAGLAPSAVKNLIMKIKEINQTYKIPILLVEQNIRQALLISNRAYIMKNGKISSEENEPKNLLPKENFEKIYFLYHSALTF